jgi:TetR/AcrR family transcriptional regulator, transcriptional repressor of bet genes
MQSVNNEIAQETKRSFIEEARRAQIVAATIETLAEVGYGKASMAQIARRARISPSLIAYHFHDKEALIFQTLGDIASAWEGYVEAQVAAAATPEEQLRNYIVANLAYMGTRPAQYAALIEIMFNARMEDGQLLYRIDEEDTAITLLKTVLARGQGSGEFRQFDLHHMALAIRGAINEFFGEMHKAGADLEAYTAAVVELFTRAIAREQPPVKGRPRERAHDEHEN